MSDELHFSLKSARSQAGLTQKQVEAELGMRKLMMKDYETGRLKLPLEVAIDLAWLYKISLDELIHGGCRKQRPQRENLSKLELLFYKESFDLVYTDPVIRSYIETYSDQLLISSLYDILTTELTEIDKGLYQRELITYLSSLIAADGKVLNSELDFVSSLSKNFIGDKFSVLASKDLSRSLSQIYLPSMMNPVLKKNIHLRHFIIWVMFFLAKSDSELNFQEIQYIEKVAEHFKILKDNYLFILNKFQDEDDL